MGRGPRRPRLPALAQLKRSSARSGVRRTSDPGSAAPDPARFALSARLFDADRTDRAVDLTPEVVADIPDRCLLWVDAVGGDVDAISSLLDLLGVALTTGTDTTTDTRAQRDQPSDPLLQLHGTYFHLHLATIATHKGRERTSTLDLIAGRNFVVTLHAEPIGFMTDFDERIEHDTALGQIDSAAFVAVLLDALVTSYLLGDLVALRHRIAMARRALTNHREVFAALARPDFEAIAGSSATAYFQAVAARFERAIDAVEGTRDSLVGTFDIHATRTAQRTNDIVKILTIVSVLLLPTTVIAGFMGMNIKAPYSNDNPLIFWVVLAVIVGVAAMTLIVLRLRRWL